MLCKPLTDYVPKCATNLVLETDLPNQNVQIRVEKFNGQVKYFNVPSDALGTVQIPFGPFFLFYDADFIFTVKNGGFVSNLGIHDKLIIRVENTLDFNSTYFVNNEIVYICCEKTFNCLCPA
jgi:hypothetical protein